MDLTSDFQVEGKGGDGNDVIDPLSAARMGVTHIKYSPQDSGQTTAFIEEYLVQAGYSPETDEAWQAIGFATRKGFEDYVEQAKVAATQPQPPQR